MPMNIYKIVTKWIEMASTGSSIYKLNNTLLANTIVIPPSIPITKAAQASTLSQGLWNLK